MLRDPGQECRLPGNELAMAATEDVAHYHQVELVTAHAGVFQRGPHHRCRQCRRGQVLEAPSESSDRRAAGSKHENVGHTQMVSRCL